jgi:hypothetical protein
MNLTRIRITELLFATVALAATLLPLSSSAQYVINITEDANQSADEIFTASLTDGNPRTGTVEGQFPVTLASGSPVHGNWRVNLNPSSGIHLTLVPNGGTADLPDYFYTAEPDEPNYVNVVSVYTDALLIQSDVATNASTILGHFGFMQPNFSIFQVGTLTGGSATVSIEFNDLPYHAGGGSPGGAPPFDLGTGTVPDGGATWLLLTLSASALALVARGAGHRRKLPTGR